MMLDAIRQPSMDWLAVTLHEEQIGKIVTAGNHVVPDIDHRWRVIDSGLCGLVSSPRRGDRDIERDARTTSAQLISQEEPARHQPTHAVGDDVVLGEAVLELQSLHRLVEMVGQAGKTDSGWVIVQPGLILRPVEMLDEKTKVYWRAINAVDEQHGNLSDIVRLEEIDAGADIENKVIRPPQAFGRMFFAEALIFERGHHTIRGRGSEG